MQNKNILFIASAATIASVNLMAQQNTRFLPKGEDYNVVFILLDQMSAKVISSYGGNFIQTPNIDRIATNGVRFENSICTVPFSSPARASLVTGMYPNQTGIIVNFGDNKPGTMDPRFILTESVLFNNGYNTKFAGKWHLGVLQNYKCFANSLDGQQFGKTYNIEYSPAQPANKGEVLVSTSKGGFYQTKLMYDFSQNGPTNAVRSVSSTIGRMGITQDQYKWTYVVNDCLDFMQQNKDDKFMVTISLEPPHAPWKSFEPYYSMIDPAKIPLLPSSFDKESRFNSVSDYQTGQHWGEAGTREKMRNYLALCLTMDDYVGKILDKLDELNLTDKTLVVFTSDHGDPISSHGFLAGKTITGFVDETSLSPAIMSMPGILPKGKVVKSHFASVDFGPTILDLLGKEIPSSMQGHSFVPIIEGSLPDTLGFAYMFRPEARGIRAGINGKIYTYYKVFNLTAKSITREELFCITDDPGERNNLYNKASSADVISKMKSIFNDFAKKYGDHPIETIHKLPIYNPGNTILQEFPGNLCVKFDFTTGGNVSANKVLPLNIDSSLMTEVSKFGVKGQYLQPTGFTTNESNMGYKYPVSVRSFDVSNDYIGFKIKPKVSLAVDQLTGTWKRGTAAGSADCVKIIISDDGFNSYSDLYVVENVTGNGVQQINENYYEPVIIQFDTEAEIRIYGWYSFESTTNSAVLFETLNLFGNQYLGEDGTSTHNLFSENIKISIKNNPVTDRLFFNGIEENRIVSIYSITGQKILSAPYLNSGINVSNLNKGIYVVFVSGKNLHTEKLMFIKN